MKYFKTVDSTTKAKKSVIAESECCFEETLIIDKEDLQALLDGKSLYSEHSKTITFIKLSKDCL
ncbi:hypothetical protein D3C73_1561000 [compost metagenome]